MDDRSYWTRPLKLHELLEEIENDDWNIPDDIVLFPPRNDIDTDEDSGEEDNVNLNNLPGGQLLTEIEVAGAGSDSEHNSDSEDDLPLSIYGTKIVGGKIVKRKRIYKWCKQDLNRQIIPWKNANGPKQQYTPLEAFSLFFSDEVFDLLIQYTNMYAQYHNRNGDITRDEMRCFFGVLLLSGYTCHPRRSMLWQNSKDTNNILVSEAISRNRFDFIMQNIHCCDNNNLVQNDKFTKLIPLIEVLNENFIAMAPMEAAHSIDESMVPYFGRHGSKQFIRGKPIRWGYKLWTGTTKTGYIEWFEPYQGATTVISNKYKDLGLGMGVVLHFADILLERYPNIPFHLYFDNFFTTLHLIEELDRMGLKGTGTIRENRIGKECTLSPSMVMKKKDRGSFEYVASDSSNIVLCKWHDNSVVTIASNYDKVLPTVPVKRYSQKEKKIF